MGREPVAVDILSEIPGVDFTRRKKQKRAGDETGRR
jgi:hypothetical protein